MTRKHLWRHATATPYGFVVAVWALLIGLRVFLDPSSSPVASVHPIHVLVVPYGIMSIAAGVMMIVGSGIRHSKTEAAGNALLIGVMAIQALAVFLIQSQFSSLWTVTVLILVAIAAGTRVKRLIRGDHLVWVHVNGDAGKALSHTEVVQEKDERPDTTTLAGMVVLPFLLAATAVGPDLSWVLAAGGIIAAVGTALVAFRKARPDSASVLVDSAQDVVVIQRTMIDALRAEMDKTAALARDCQRRIQELQSLEGEVASLRMQIRDLTTENQRLRKANSQLQKRIRTLENGHHE
jgi:FtsZ-binding cell division protein ZapB